VWGGNTGARVLIGFGAGAARVGVQGLVTRRDGSLVATFSEQQIGGSGGWFSSWGEQSAVRRTARDVGHTVGAMVREAECRGGHPGDDGYLADGFLGPVGAADRSAEHAPAGPSPADRLRALENLRAQGLISDAEYAEKRKQILQEF
jgi:hypothetical protein